MEQGFEGPFDDRQERVVRLKDDILEHVTREFEDERCFDNMEIARALVAVAFKRLEAIEGVEAAVSYYRHLQGCSERYLGNVAALVHESALRQEEERQLTGRE